MTPSKARAKGHKVCVELAASIWHFLTACGVTNIGDSDRWIAPSGIIGADVRLPSELRIFLPLCFECKNKEKLNIWGALKQAETYRTPFELPALAFRRNRTDLYITMKATDFFTLLKRCAITKT